jgi:hypothetical protein
MALHAARSAGLAALTAATLAGCAGSDAPDHPAPAPGRSADERLVRAWSAALARDDFRAAAALFARGALIEQTRTFRLRTRRAALAFNLSLPCRGSVTRVEDEGKTSVAAFSLSPRPGVPAAACDAVVRVRFRSRAGRFVEWRQLPEPVAPSGRPV